MASEAESKVLESIASLVQAIGVLVESVNLMAQSNAMIAEALLAGPMELEDEEGEQRHYMDGSPIQ